MDTILFLASFFFLILGAELLVRGSVKLAAGFGVPPLIIGLTIVSFGTSAPELVTGVVASYHGQTEIALGNVLGSNILNILLILGISALISPIQVKQKLVILDVPIMIGSSLLLMAFALTGTITYWMGWCFFLLFIGYNLFTIYFAGPSSEFEKEFSLKEEFTPKQGILSVVFVLIGMFFLHTGSELLVEGATKIAEYFAISPLLISLTIIAVGTSLPELATSIIASYRGEKDIAAGNVIGSNIFNILAVLGLSSIVSKDGIPIPNQAISFDIPVVVATAIVSLPIFFTNHTISRREGGIFLLYFCFYFLYLFLLQTGHELLAPFQSAMVLFIIPLTIIAIISSIRGHLVNNK